MKKNLKLDWRDISNIHNMNELGPIVALIEFEKNEKLVYHVYDGTKPIPTIGQVFYFDMDCLKPLRALWIEAQFPDSTE